MIINVYWSHVMYSLFLLDFSEKFPKVKKISNLMKIAPVGAEFHADGQTVIVLLAEFSLFEKSSQNTKKTQVWRIVKTDCKNRKLHITEPIPMQKCVNA